MPADLAHVGVADSSGKSVSKNSPVGGVEFDLPGCVPAGLFKSEIEAADPGEETAEGFAFMGSPRFAAGLRGVVLWSDQSIFVCVLAL